MGADKAFVLVDERPLISYPFAVLGRAGATEVIAVGGSTARLDELGLRAVRDELPGSGPLGGVITGLSHATEDHAFVLSCDQPAMRAEVVVEMLDRLAAGRCDAVVPVVDGRRLALSAAYRVSAQRALRAAFDRGERAPHRGLDELDLELFEPDDPALFVDLDDPDDVRRYASSRLNPPLRRK